MYFTYFQATYLSISVIVSISHIITIGVSISVVLSVSHLITNGVKAKAAKPLEKQPVKCRFR